MMNSNSMCVFIPSHGRASKVITIPHLRNQGYTGPIYIVCDDIDEQLPEYQKLYGDMVIVFKKDDYHHVDVFDNFRDNRTCVHARHAIQDIAKKMGILNYLVIDDDLSQINFRTPTNGHLKSLKTSKLDDIFRLFFEYLESAPVDCIAMGQAGDVVGGASNPLFRKQFKRKIMNSFFCRSDRRINFLGRFNDDVNAYVIGGKTGKIYLSEFKVFCNPIITQSYSGGSTEMYQKYGTYTKSFYTVMASPSSVTISVIGDKHPRIHHHIDFRKTVPLILNERYRRV